MRAQSEIRTTRDSTVEAAGVSLESGVRYSCCRVLVGKSGSVVQYSPVTLCLANTSSLTSGANVRDGPMMYNVTVLRLLAGTNLRDDPSRYYKRVSASAVMHMCVPCQQSA